METVLFIITALLAVGCGLAMLASRNPVHSALWLVVNFCAVAIMYLLLRAPMLSAIQVTVYAGAIMVLFLFVIMLLGVERGERSEDKVRWTRPLAGLLLAVLLAEGGYILFNADRLGSALPAPVPAEQAAAVSEPVPLSMALFERYLLPFEITSVLLLVAIIGAVVLTRIQRKEAK